LSEDSPVIIGAGLSGLAISHFLSEAGVAHVLIGALPDSRPRLGESIDPAGTVALLEFFPEYSRYFHLKRYVSVYTGGYAGVCDFKSNALRTLGLRLLGFGTGDEFVHVDRIGFDRALADRTVVNPSCTHRDLLVESMRYDPASDRIDHLRLSDGTTMRPRFVFDATNHVRLVARKAEIGIEWAGDLQRVAFRHYRAPDEASDDCRGGGWKHCTSLLRMYRDSDGLDGVAWCIPLGGYVSVGGSVDADATDLGDDRIVELTVDAYERRGLKLREEFPHPSETIGVRNRYFVHERACGGNWLLAGPSFGQVWFPTSSGVGCALLAGLIAPRLLESPGEVGPAFEDYVRGLLRSHVLFDEIIYRDPADLTAARITEVAEEIVAENIKRVTKLANFTGGPAAGVFARLFHWLADKKVMRAGWQVHEADLPQQTTAVFHA